MHFTLFLLQMIWFLLRLFSNNFHAIFRIFLLLHNRSYRKIQPTLAFLGSFKIPLILTVIYLINLKHVVLKIQDHIHLFDLWQHLKNLLNTICIIKTYLFVQIQTIFSRHIYLQHFLIILTKIFGPFLFIYNKLCDHNKI